MQQRLPTSKRDAADACWDFDDDDADRLAETLPLLPKAYPGAVHFEMSRLGPAKSSASGCMMVRNFAIAAVRLRWRQERSKCVEITFSGIRQVPN